MELLLEVLKKVKRWKQIKQILFSLFVFYSASSKFDGIEYFINNFLLLTIFLGCVLKDKKLPLQNK